MLLQFELHLMHVDIFLSSLYYRTRCKKSIASSRPRCTKIKIRLSDSNYKHEQEDIILVSLDIIIFSKRLLQAFRIFALFRWGKEREREKCSTQITNDLRPKNISRYSLLFFIISRLPFSAIHAVFIVFSLSPSPLFVR